MNANDFTNVSMLGRTSYLIMCAENYVLAKAPEKDWKPLFEIMWRIAGDDMWDTWMGKMTEIIPECLLEFNTYESADFDKISKEEYETLKSLYADMPDDLNTIIDNIFENINIYAYGSIPGTGKDSLDIISETSAILTKEGIDLPDADKVAFTSFDEMSGWGNNFDFREKGLSVILK